MNTFRENERIITVYDWINVPLVYPQIVTFAVYVYFFSLMFAYQHIPPRYLDRHKIDRTNYQMEPFYLPIYTICMFLFFMGWAKVAEGLMNPFGENDDDLDCNWYIERNIRCESLRGWLETGHVGECNVSRFLYGGNLQ